MIGRMIVRSTVRSARYQPAPLRKPAPKMRAKDKAGCLVAAILVAIGWCIMCRHFGG